MNSFEIRQKFLEYFQKNGHTVVASSSLIPEQDPTLLFTNAGMNQFKDCFLGKEKRSYVRATTAQKCVRAGGKHNDLDQVGFTERHLTFFEMLGNFSFGDYFKKEAIQFAWKFLTEDMGLDGQNMYASVFRDDQESYDIWHKVIGLPTDRIVRLGEADNFWAMGDTGPCGPCTEIYVDRGPTIGCKQPTCSPGCSCARYLEIWNNVFMQYNRQPDGTLELLTQTGVDTGMGLERLCMVMQGKTNVFESDPLMLVINAIEKITDISYEKSNADLQGACRVLADHIRSSALLIADGCSPANDGRGYVLRKIIRRAALFSEKISTDPRLFSKLAKQFIDTMQSVWPELKQREKLIIAVLDNEVDRFAQNLIGGQNILAKYVEEHKAKGTSQLTGIQVFKLYDTYGFPPELTEIVASENNMTIDREGFESEMKRQQLLSGKKMKEHQGQEFAVDGMRTTFVGYDELTNTSKVQFVQQREDSIWLATDATPFFAETGGQVDDSGIITINNQTFPVIGIKKAGETFNPVIMLNIPLVALDGTKAKAINIGDIAHSVVDSKIRPCTVKNHTATHMLQSALIEALGSHVKQAGSVVHPDYLRFDFTHHQPLSKEEIKRVEERVNEKIQENIPVEVVHTTMQEAQRRGALMPFGDRYNPETVRMIVISDYSIELCGGTHADRTGVIGVFKIVSESSLATGVRRIVALTGPKSLELYQQTFSQSKLLSEHYKVKIEQVTDAVERQQEQLAHASSVIKQLKKQLMLTCIPQWQQQIKPVAGIPFLYLELEDVTNDEMKQVIESLTNHTPGFYVIIGKVAGEKRFNFVSHAHANVGVDLKAFGVWLKNSFDIKGGGNPPTIQGGGAALPEGFAAKIETWIVQR